MLSARSLAAVLALLAAPARAAEAIPSSTVPQLTVQVTTPQRFNGVAVASDGRVFMPIQRDDPDRGWEVGVVRDGAVVAYPDDAWNGWSRGKDPRNLFVGVNAVRIGPEGDLWIVDPAKTGQSAKAIPEGIKLVRIDLTTNRVKRVYPLAAVAGADSFVDDIRFNGATAYLTDAGAKAGLIVLDTQSGKARRVLDDTPVVTQNGRTLTGEGKPLVDKDGKPVVVNADQLEVSPDGSTFYFQACTGPLYSIPTALLDDPGATPAQLRQGVTLYADTHSTGGSAMAADGTIFISDTDRAAVLRIAPGGAITTLVQDPRLVWVDAMWIDPAGRLWLPASQRNRSAGMNGGQDAIVSPLQIFTLPVEARPVPH